QRLVEVLALDHGEPGEDLAGLREGAVGDEHAVALLAQRGRRGDGGETQDRAQRARAPEVVLPRSHQGEHLGDPRLALRGGQRLERRVVEEQRVFHDSLLDPAYWAIAVLNEGRSSSARK